MACSVGETDVVSGCRATFLDTVPASDIWKLRRGRRPKTVGSPNLRKNSEKRSIAPLPVSTLLRVLPNRKAPRWQGRGFPEFRYPYPSRRADPALEHALQMTHKLTVRSVVFAQALVKFINTAQARAAIGA